MLSIPMIFGHPVTQKSPILPGWGFYVRISHQTNKQRKKTRFVFLQPAVVFHLSVYASNAAARSYPRKPLANMEKATCA
jgi:hypothetical protein